MVYHIELSPEITKALRAEADTEGISEDILLRRVLENRFKPVSATMPAHIVSVDELDAAVAQLDALDEEDRVIAPLPPRHLDRSSMYENHL